MKRSTKILIAVVAGVAVAAGGYLYYKYTHSDETPAVTGCSTNTDCVPPKTCLNGVCADTIPTYKYEIEPSYSIMYPHPSPENVRMFNTKTRTDCQAICEGDPKCTAFMYRDPVVSVPINCFTIDSDSTAGLYISPDPEPEYSFSYNVRVPYDNGTWGPWPSCPTRRESLLNADAAVTVERPCISGKCVGPHTRYCSDAAV